MRSGFGTGVDLDGVVAIFFNIEVDALDMISAGKVLGREDNTPSKLATITGTNVVINFTFKISHGVAPLVIEFNHLNSLGDGGGTVLVGNGHGNGIGAAMLPGGGSSHASGRGRRTTLETPLNVGNRADGVGNNTELGSGFSNDTLGEVERNIRSTTNHGFESQKVGHVRIADGSVAMGNTIRLAIDGGVVSS